MKSYPLILTEGKVIGQCPECDRKSDLGITSLEEAEGATADCAWCGTLLIVQDGQVYEFHKKINEGDQRWPADGKGTGFIEC